MKTRYYIYMQPSGIIEMKRPGITYMHHHASRGLAYMLLLMLSLIMRIWHICFHLQCKRTQHAFTYNARGPGMLSLTMQEDLSMQELNISRAKYMKTGPLCEDVKGRAPYVKTN